MQTLDQLGFEENPTQDLAKTIGTSSSKTPAAPSVAYRECLKNHAASNGNYAVDGCREFMPTSGEEGTQESLKCAACDCHRSFHRKEPSQFLALPTLQHFQASSSGSKKRFRTKFSEEQKEKMREFATKLGWSLQNEDDQEMHKFCREVGVKRRVFKVWMHNNKKRQI